MKHLLVVMDPLASIKPYKDTTVALLLEAQRRGYALSVCTPADIWLRNASPAAMVSSLRVSDEDSDWYAVTDRQRLALTSFDLIMMRKDPPFDSAYLHATYMLELAEQQGVPVCNRPQALRDANEKLAALWFPGCIPETLVATRAERIREFVIEQQDCVLKPLDGMGGRSIFKTSALDPNLNVIIETLTADGRQAIMAQQYLQAIKDGDIRVLLIGGKPVPYVLARMPGKQDFRGNLARGGSGVPRAINTAEQAIAELVGPELLRRGIWFAGIDVIGDRLTEVNVTSPTCVRELEREYGINICADLYQLLENTVMHQH